MERITQVAIETDRGLRTLELYCGDLTEIPFTVDILCISAFPGQYWPLPRTVIEALKMALGLSVFDERKNCEFDLTGQLGIWISRELDNPKYRRIVCAEAATATSAINVLDHVFVGVAILEALDVQVKTVAMPLLFSGSLAMEPQEMATGLVPAVKALLMRSSQVDRAIFVEKDSSRAQALAVAIDTTLGRVHVALSHEPIITNLKQGILLELSATRNLVPEGHLHLVEEIEDALSQTEVRAVDIGVLARRAVEFVMNDLLGEAKTSPDLISRIDKLAGKGVASWMQSYMHLLRILGNEVAHEKSSAGKRPPRVEEADLTICLLCMHRIWSFWAEWRNDST